MGILSKLFGSKEHTSDVISMVRNAGDALVFTDEERAAANADYRQWYLQWLAATQPQTLARRFIAIAVTLLWCAMLIVAIVAWPLSPEYSNYILGLLTQVVAVPFAGIMAFYFAAHLTRAFRKDSEKE